MLTWILSTVYFLNDTTNEHLQTKGSCYVNNIQICCIDEHIYDQSKVTADICYHVSQNQPVELRLENASFAGSGEGASLASLGVYDILDHISQLWPHTPYLS